MTKQRKAINTTTQNLIKKGYEIKSVFCIDVDNWVVVDYNKELNIITTSYFTYDVDIDFMHLVKVKSIALS